MHFGSNLPQRTTSEKRTKTVLPKCPLFRGSTVYFPIYSLILLTHTFFYYLYAHDQVIEHYHKTFLSLQMQFSLMKDLIYIIVIRITNNRRAN